MAASESHSGRARKRERFSRRHVPLHGRFALATRGSHAATRTHTLYSAMITSVVLCVSVSRVTVLRGPVPFGITCVVCPSHSASRQKSTPCHNMHVKHEAEGTEGACYNQESLSYLNSIISTCCNNNRESSRRRI